MKNIGNIDRILRLLIGCLLLSQTVIGLQTMWGLAGLILIVTSLFSFCPIYRLFKISSCSKTSFSK